MTSPATATRLYQDGKVVAQDFGPDDAQNQLDQHPGSVLWLDLLHPDAADLDKIAAAFELHPLAVEDALADHERPKLDRYPNHIFLNVYAVDLSVEEGNHHFTKAELSVFVTDRALITVRKAPIDITRLPERWDANADLGRDGGVAFLLYGLLDVVVDGHYSASQQLDAAMDGVEDALLEEGGAPRPVRMHAMAIRKTVAAFRRAIAPMPELVGQAARADLDVVDEHLRPYFRDVEDHAKHTVDQVEHLRERIEQLLQADLAEQGNVLNDVTRKLAAWAAIVAVPTAVTGYFGQNLPYPGYDRFWGWLVSTALIVVISGGLYVSLKRRGWL
ncbi:magnesium transporter CorA family protein [Actinoplanes sp. NPDC049596]|uniref:magnesium transporter CorA family protein n=1 Tax=unclassified Actinoplanes TaxID=2626549 RepID=UPI00343DEAAF